MPDFDPNEYLKKQSQSKGFDPNKYLEENTIEKKNLVQSVSTTGTQPLPIGSKPFLPQVSTKIPSVLTPKGQVGYQEQVKDFKPIVQKQPPLPKVEKPLSNLESIKNTVYNVANSLKGVLPRLSLTSVDVFEKVIGKDLTGRLASLPRIEFSSDGVDIVTGRTPEQIRNESIKSLDYLNTQVAPTAGIVENARNFNIPGLAAGVIDAAGGLVSTIIPSALSGGSLLVTEMVGGGLYDYNTAKAKSKGVSTEQLYKSGDADFGVPAAIGGVAYSMERIGLKGFTNAISKKLAGSGFKKALLLGTEWNKEGLTEWVQVGLDEANLALANGLSVEDAAIAAADKMSSVKGLEAYAKGFAGSAAASGTARGLKRLISPKNKIKVSELEQQKNQSLQDLANENIPIEAKNAILDVLENTNEQIDDLVNIDRKEVEQLSESQSGRVGEINAKIENIDLAINDANISESTKTILEKQKQELDSEIDGIIAAPEIKVAKPTFDTEEQLIAEGQQAEAEYTQTGDQVTYEQKIKELEEREKNLVPAPEDAEIGNPEEVVEVEPIRQLGTGANVYFETEKYRVNDGLKNGNVLLNIQSKTSEAPIANIEFDNANDAVIIAQELNNKFPDGVPDAILIDKYIEQLKNDLLKPKEDAIQEQGLQKSIKSTTFVDEEIKPDLIPEGSQKELRVDSKTIRNFKEKDTVERNNSSIQTWLESISRNDKKEKRNEGEELFGESVFSKESQAGVLLDDIYRKWQSLRAQTLDESKVGQDIGTTRTRTSLEQQRVGQQNRELAIIDELRAQETSQQDSEQGNISENSRKKQVEAGRMVEKILELSSLPNDPKKASVARALRDLLSSSTQKEKELIINEIKNKLYAVSQSISSKVPVLTEATVGEEVEQGKPQPEAEVVTEEGGKAEEVGGDVGDAESVIRKVYDSQKDKINKGEYNIFSKLTSKDYWERTKAGELAIKKFNELGESLKERYGYDVLSNVSPLDIIQNRKNKIIFNNKGNPIAIVKLVSESSDTFYDYDKYTKELKERYGSYVILDNIYSLENGGGKEAINQIKDIADKNGVSIILKASGIENPQTDKLMTPVKKLKNIYTSLGFEKVEFKDLRDTDVFIYKPKEQTPAQQVEQLRAEEQAELNAAIPNADQYLTDGKVDRIKITDAKDLEAFDKIYDKYDRLITPLLPKKEAPAKAEPKLKSKVATRLLFKKAVDLFYDISGTEGSAKKRTISAKRRTFMEQNPSIKYIDDNWPNISKQLKEKGLLEKSKGCP